MSAKMVEKRHPWTTDDQWAATVTGILKLGKITPAAAKAALKSGRLVWRERLSIRVLVKQQRQLK